jgi:hypothetical protein
MHYVYSEHGGERAIQLPAVGARLRANAAGKSLCGVRPQADAYSANTGAPNHPIARERGGRESIRGIVGNAQGGAGAAKHRDVRERAMHMEVLVPQSTGTCESGQCTGRCWCRKAQGRARAGNAQGCAGAAKHRDVRERPCPRIRIWNIPARGALRHATARGGRF